MCFRFKHRSISVKRNYEIVQQDSLDTFILFIYVIIWHYDLTHRCHLHWGLWEHVHTPFWSGRFCPHHFLKAPFVKMVWSNIDIIQDVAPWAPAENGFYWVLWKIRHHFNLWEPEGSTSQWAANLHDKRLICRIFDWRKINLFFLQNLRRNSLENNLKPFFRQYSGALDPIPELLLQRAWILLI